MNTHPVNTYPCERLSPEATLIRPGRRCAAGLVLDYLPGVGEPTVVVVWTTNHTLPIPWPFVSPALLSPE